jgi:hypothetical protein
VLVANGAAEGERARIIPSGLGRWRDGLRHRDDVPLMNPSRISVRAFYVEPQPVALDDLCDVAVEEL